MVTRKGGEAFVKSQRIERALADVESWDDEHLVGQLFSVASGGHAAKDIMGLGSADPAAAHARMLDDIRRFHLGGVIYFPPGGTHEPVASIRESVQAFQAAAETPLVVATDQENGTVARVRNGATHLPGAMALGATADPQLWADTAAASAVELRSVGITQTFAPVADLNVTSENPSIGIRSAGSDPVAACRQIDTVVRTLRSNGVAPTLKHFPGYGSASTDPHLGLPTIPMDYDEWTAGERRVFAAGIRAGADAIMIAHILFPAVDPDLPATFSPKLLRTELRDKLGFEGVIVTDAMDMGGAVHPDGPAEACVCALAAGADQILMPAHLPDAFEAVLGALRSGRLDQEELRTSARRILTLKARYAPDHFPVPDLSVCDTDEHRDLARRTAEASVAWRDGEQHHPLRTDGGPVLLIDPGPDPVRRGADPASILTPVLEALGREVTVAHWDELMAQAGSGRAVAPTVPAGATDAVVVLRDAWKEGQPVTQLLRDLSARGLDVRIVVTRSPHDATLVPRSYPVLLTYGDNEYALRAAADVLTGHRSAVGGLPMPVGDLESTEAGGRQA